MSEKNINSVQRESVTLPDSKWMSLIFGQETAELDEKEDEKIELFEKGLAKELKPSDTIDAAFTKIVRMALGAEFGPSFVKAKGAKGMIDTIVRGIMGDSGLRKQALLIIDRFAKKSN